MRFYEGNTKSLKDSGAFIYSVEMTGDALFDKEWRAFELEIQEEKGGSRPIPGATRRESHIGWHLMV